MIPNFFLNALTNSAILSGWFSFNDLSCSRTIVLASLEMGSGSFSKTDVGSSFSLGLVRVLPTPTFAGGVYEHRFEQNQLPDVHFLR